VETSKHRKGQAARAQNFALWQQATTEITRCDHSMIACSRHLYMGVVLRAHSVRGESHNQRQPRVCYNAYKQTHI